jgi:hypothetical protein
MAIEFDCKWTFKLQSYTHILVLRLQKFQLLHVAIIWHHWHGPPDITLQTIVIQLYNKSMVKYIIFRQN